MSGTLPDREASDDRRAEPQPGPPPSTPRWMPALGIAVAVLLMLALVVLHLSGAIGPGVH